jgi:hypothetical protein
MGIPRSGSTLPCWSRYSIARDGALTLLGGTPVGQTGGVGGLKLA